MHTSTQPSEHVLKVRDAFEQPTWYLRGYQANIRVRCETVVDFVGDRSFSNVLDVGCGDGSLSLPFLSKGSRVTFLDLSTSMLEIVEKKIPSEQKHLAQFINGDFIESDLPMGSYDLVLFVGVMAYVPDVAVVASRIRSLLRPGGIAIVECTDAVHPLARLNIGYRALTAKFREGKCQTFRHQGQQVIGHFQSAGFGLKSTFRCSYTVPLVTRFFSQDRLYTAMRTVYGHARAPRAQRFGGELLMLFEAPAK